MGKRKTSSIEAIELAEEHVKLASNLIHEEAKKTEEGTPVMKELSEAAFALEKAESEVRDVKELLADMFDLLDKSFIK